MSEIDLKSHLLKTAARLFQRQGYAAVSLRKIAAEAGVTTGSLYYYFNDKDEVVHEILDTGHRRALVDVRRAVQAVGLAADRRAMLRAAVLAHLEAIFEDSSFPAASIRIFPHVPPHLRAAVRPGRIAYVQFWTDLVTLGDPSRQPLVAPRHMAMYLLGAANGTLEWYKANRQTLEEVADDLTFVFFEVVASARAARPAARKTAA